jgi:hypothetical protein
MKIQFLHQRENFSLQRLAALLLDNNAFLCELYETHKYNNGQSAKFSTVKEGGICNYHCNLRGGNMVVSKAKEYFKSHTKYRST